MNAPRVTADDLVLDLLRAMQRETVNAMTDDELPPDRWTTETLARDFEVLGFLAPYVIVVRRSDGVTGSLMFRHYPRVYFSFAADEREAPR